MRLLLDSHTLIWAVERPASLSPMAVSALQNSTNDLLLSAGTIWEIAIKVGLKKLTLSQTYLAWIGQANTALGLSILPITAEYAAAQAMLPNHHKDPFDRLLVAQALIESVPIVSADSALDLYGIIRLW